MPTKDHRLIEDDAEEIECAKLFPEECAIVTNLDLLGRARKVLGGELARDIGRTLAESSIAYAKKKKLTRLAVKSSYRVSGDTATTKEMSDENLYPWEDDWRYLLEWAFDEALAKGSDHSFVSLQRGGGGKLNFMPLDMGFFLDGLIYWSVNYKPFAMSVGNQQEAEDLLKKYDLLLENEENWKPHHSGKEGKAHRKNGRWRAEVSVPLEIKADPSGKRFKVETCWPLMKRVFDGYAKIERRYSKLPLEIRNRLGGWRP